jgi:uncharacterized membrane protein YphA (DoxX/SURF4 family)
VNIALWIAQGMLAALYFTAGGMKAFQTARFRENPQMDWANKRSDNYLRFIGVAELLGALGLVLPTLTGIFPVLTPLAAIGLTLIQILAIFMVHLPRREFSSLAMNLVLIAMQIFIIIGRLVT